MLSTVHSAGLFGIDGFLVNVEADGQPRLPYFELVGLPDLAVKEAKERVRTACENSGYRFPVVNLLLDYDFYGYGPWFGKTFAATTRTRPKER